MGAGSVVASAWNMVAVTCSNGVERLWRDGVMVASRTSPRSIGASTNALLIGAATTSARFFLGTIDDLRIYNRNLSASEVAQLHVSESVPLPSPPSLRV